MMVVASFSLLRKAFPLFGDWNSFAASDAMNCVVMKVGLLCAILESMISK